MAESFKVVIPARFESSRFPGKVIAKINEKPMIQHVWERACESDADEVIIAVDNNEVGDKAREFGADVEKTDIGAHSGTDRIREVLENRGWDDDTIIINVQGDSPLISPLSINQVASLLVNSDADIATLATRITKPEDFYNSNVVKVLWDSYGRALYFSRAPIPAQENSNSVWAWRHLGIYGYTTHALRLMTSCPPGTLEKFERLEQLRAMNLGLQIKVAIAQEPHHVDVDVPGDVETVENIMVDGASDR
jgi:3-deoxy-manno-octulosonate cytidylyltransferase (CMP-KDO synthetase)